MHLISDASLKRNGWNYQPTPGGGFVGYPAGKQPYINWKHIDGPLLYTSEGQLHWLTLRERFRCWLGLDDMASLNAKHVRG